MRHPVFYDPSRRRAVRISIASAALAVVSTLLVAAFITSVLVFSDNKGADILLNSGRNTTPIPPELALKQELLPVAKRLGREAARQRRLSERATMPGIAPGKARHDASPQQKPLTVGFYVNWDESSYASLKRALPVLDWVVPSWLFLEGQDMTLKTDLDDKSLDLMRRTAPRVEILPMIQNANDGQWDGSGLARLLADSASRKARLAEIVAFLRAHSLQGLTVDFEAVPKDAQPALQAFLQDAHAALAPLGLRLAVAVPLDNPEWDYRSLGKIADYVMLMAYDEHDEGGKAGPIASQGWFVKSVSARMRELDASRTIVAIGNYGYDWSKDPTEDLTFQESVLSALDSEASIGFDPESLNPYFAYSVDGDPHRVWFLDAVTAYNQLRAADAFRPRGYAIWRLGSEDPSIWSVLDHQYDATAPAALRTIDPGNDVDFVGDGEILQIASEPKKGARDFAMDKDGIIIASETYTQTPTAYVIRRTGAAPGKVALTFDDGPDAEWTPKILDILKERAVYATFFIVGENGERNPRLIRRILDEGHEIGNHTFTHPNLGETSSRVTQIELNATQRLVEALTGRSMRLFRPPYFGDAEPTTNDEIAALREAGNLGYITVGLKVDPGDWREPPADEIVTNVMERMADTNPETRGQVVLLHDGGGDREQTVNALPALIDQLRASGQSIVPVSELAGWTRDQVMPPVSAEDYAPVVNRVVFLTLHAVLSVLNWLIVVAIGLGFGRLIVLCGLALWGRRKAVRHAGEQADQTLSVSVLIPAYNEARVICASVQRILESDYRRLQVIVIDDGSSDATSELVRRHFGDEPRVTLITIPNSGKATAVNIGLAQARGDVVVALDADTQFERETIARLCRWFADPQIAAVAGNAKVGNRINTLTRWQALEYIVAQNLERRALAALGCITVVPGAVGAWRRDVLVELGGFPSDTLAEDQDLTITVQKAGHKVVFDPEAIAWTEAPDTLSGLAKQRFRWAFGTLQCLWKHGEMLLSPRYGWLGMVGIPQIWLFQILLSLVSPFVDLMLVSQLLGAAIDYLQHGEQYDPSHLQLTLFYYALFMTVDLTAAFAAFAFEKTEDWRLLWWLVLQRFGYRQLMYYVVVKSVVSAAKGRLVGWSKLERKATVNRAGREPRPAAAAPAVEPEQLTQPVE